MEMEAWLGGIHSMYNELQILWFSTLYQYLMSVTHPTRPSDVSHVGMVMTVFIFQQVYKPSFSTQCRQPCGNGDASINKVRQWSFWEQHYGPEIEMDTEE
jgi:hypothetical protein